MADEHDITEHLIKALEEFGEALEELGERDTVLEGHVRYICMEEVKVDELPWLLDTLFGVQENVTFWMVESLRAGATMGETTTTLSIMFSFEEGNTYARMVGEHLDLAIDFDPEEPDVFNLEGYTNGFPR